MNRASVLPILALAACADPATHDTLPLAQDLAAEAAAAFEPASTPLSWIETVLGWGMLAVDDASGRDRAWSRAWIDAHLQDFAGDEPKEFRASDEMAPASVAAALMADDRMPSGRKARQITAPFLMSHI